jgi:hypothetical protein
MAVMIEFNEVRAPDGGPWKSKGLTTLNMRLTATIPAASPIAAHTQSAGVTQNSAPEPWGIRCLGTRHMDCDYP